MTYHVDIRPGHDLLAPLAERLAHAAEMVLGRQNAPEGSALTLVITNAETVQDMNRRFRQVDKPTDVLAFPADPPPVPEAAPTPYLGDIVIAYPRAMAQAKAAGHTLEDELLLLAVHGTLHLLGFDHDTGEARAAMWEAQAGALQAVGASITGPP